MKIFSKEFQTRSLRTLAFIISFLLLATLPAGAQVTYAPPPSHNCLRPVRPFEWSSHREKNQYRKDVEAYMNCLKQFVEEQKEAIRKHKEAAEAAIEEWKNFVKELKGLK